jgi:hypothetical protein
MPQVVSDVKARPAVRQLIQSRGLNDDDITMLVAIKIEHPYPVYRWMNGFLYSNRRDLDVVNCVGPAFTMLHRAMLKLPQVKVNANRGAVVNGVPSLKSIYDGYEERLPPKSKLSFWGTSSFTTSSKVLSSQYFIGGHGVEAIVYSCEQLTGVDMEPFCPYSVTVMAPEESNAFTLSHGDGGPLSHIEVHKFVGANNSGTCLELTTKRRNARNAVTVLY